MYNTLITVHQQS